MAEREKGGLLGSSLVSSQITVSVEIPVATNRRVMRIKDGSEAKKPAARSLGATCGTLCVVVNHNDLNYEWG